MDIAAGAAAYERPHEELPMIRRIIYLLAVAAIYVMVKRIAEAPVSHALDRAADADWANEGGANAPSSV